MRGKTHSRKNTQQHAGMNISSLFSMNKTQRGPDSATRQRTLDRSRVVPVHSKGGR